MEAFDSAGPEPPPSPAANRRSKRAFRICERYIWNFFKLFPLAFVYGLSTWAVWVEVKVGTVYKKSGWIGAPSTTVGILLYLCMNISYSLAVFTDPGSPLGAQGRSRYGGNRHDYSYLPTADPSYRSLTVSSTGGSRHCKKCQCPKPDRAHHCSTCGRCVLKMDHHCPWLATCVGFYNYKAFLLFLIYTCFFCYVCLAVTWAWTWNEMLADTQYFEHSLPINVILLCIISGILALVLSGFTGWHISLAARGLTTIESLEKTRYLSPLRKTLDQQRRGRQPHQQHGRNGSTRIGHTLQNYGNQLLDMHANAIPGVTRAEEGEERASPTFVRRDHDSNHPNGYNPNEHVDDYRSPAQQSLYQSYGELERMREYDRYEEYLAEEDSAKLPNAFDLGWRRNLTHLFGTNKLLWPIPISTTTGDGWHWEPSPNWLEAKNDIEQERMKRWEETQRIQQLRAQQASSRQYHPSATQMNGGHNGQFRNGVNIKHNNRYSGQDEIERPTTGVSMQTLAPRSPRPRPGEEDYDIDDDIDSYSTSSDEGGKAFKANDTTKAASGDTSGTHRREDEWRDWE